MDKVRIRERIWKLLEEENVARFPRPVYGRIPNFVGADEASRILITLNEFKNSKIVKINPDAPQRMARYYALAYNKMLIMPTPRLRSGFIIIRVNNPKEALRASTIKGALEYGKIFRFNNKIDAIVIGSVAVTRYGARLGKGEGYAEIEYAILKELRLVSDDVKVITTVHDLQIVDEIPVEEYDLPVDIIVTPKEIIYTRTNIQRPKGIIWDRLSEEKISSIPLLSKLRSGAL
ncbi:MAG: 5-formyltetrahydrofolate cyclo-ligase [Candidatus Nitrosocaldaceae archaeon]